MSCEQYNRKVISIQLKDESSKILLAKLAELSGTTLSGFVRSIIEDQYLKAVADSVNETLKAMATTDIFGNTKERSDRND